MANAVCKVIDRDRKGRIIYEAYFCAEHLKDEAPHNLEELEVTHLKLEDGHRCTFEDLAPEFQGPWWKNCAVQA